MTINSGIARKVAAVAVGAAAAIGASTAVAGPAHAEPWNPNVTLVGAIYCPGSNVVGVPETVRWGWVTSDGGSAGWASIWRSGNQIRYSVPIRVATWGSTITFKVGCQVSGERSTTFRVGRPTFGTTSNRDLRWVL